MLTNGVVTTVIAQQRDLGIQTECVSVLCPHTRITQFLSHLGDPPKIYQLEQFSSDSKTIRVIDSVAAKWEELAIALGFNASMIDRLRRDYTSDCKEACTQMLITWLTMEHCDESKPVSWSTLIDCLIDAEFSSLAVELKEMLENFSS